MYSGWLWGANTRIGTLRAETRAAIKEPTDSSYCGRRSGGQVYLMGLPLRTVVGTIGTLVGRIEDPTRVSPAHRGYRNKCAPQALRTCASSSGDRDSKFTESFDEVFRTEGARVIKTPVCAPKVNAFAERFVRTARAEVVDQVLVIGRRHLLRLLQAYEDHFNSHRPHRGIGLAAPDVRGVSPIPVPIDRIERRRVLEGLINEYHEAAA